MQILFIQFGMRKSLENNNLKKLRDWEALQTHSGSKPTVYKHQKPESEHNSVVNLNHPIKMNKTKCIIYMTTLSYQEKKNNNQTSLI